MIRTSFILVVFVGIQCACIVLRTKDFVRFQGKRLANNVDYEINEISPIACTVMCLQTPGCIAVNFNSLTTQCQICKTPSTPFGFAMETNASWNLYHGHLQDEVISFISAVAFVLKMSSAYPSMTSSDQTPPTTVSPVVLDQVTLKRLSDSLSVLNFTTEKNLNQAFTKHQLDTQTVIALVRLTQTASNPHIPNDVVNDADNCQNIQNVLSAIDAVLSGYSARVLAIPLSIGFDHAILFSRIQSAQEKVQQLMGQDDFRKEPDTVAPRDLQYTIQTLASLQIQIDTMSKVVTSLRKCH